MRIAFASEVHRHPTEISSGFPKSWHPNHPKSIGSFSQKSIDPFKALTSGNDSHSDGESPFSMGKSTISMGHVQ